MSRPAVVYVVMLVVLIAGLWAVLAMGRHVHAPEDLAGKWQLTPVSTGAPAQAVIIEQSGNFFQVSFENEKIPHLDLKLQSSSPSISLGNGKSTLQVLEAGPNPDDKIFVLSGPQTGQWNAHCVARTFPADVDSKEAR